MSQRKVGRPTLYTEELADEICEVVANSTKGLSALCEDNPHWPVRRVIIRWKRKYTEFSHKYAEAKADQCDFLADEVLSIADNSSNDTIIDENGKEKCNMEWVNRMRLRIDTRKWYVSKLAPKLYGDRIQTDIVATYNPVNALKELDK